jgi:hypothetical protein
VLIERRDAVRSHAARDGDERPVGEAKARMLPGDCDRVPHRRPPIRRHPLADLLSDAWNTRERLRLVDALYVALAGTLASTALLTTDARLARECDLAELIAAAR